MRPRLLIMALAGGACLLLALCHADTLNSVSKEPPLAPSEPFWFFGLIPPDSWVTHHYRLTNNHNDTVTILKIIPGCDCTHVPAGPIKIPPGQSYLLKASFDSKTYTGEINRDIHLVTDFAPSPDMYLYFGTFIGPPLKSLSIIPGSMVFIPGKQSQTVTIANTSSEPTRIRVLLDNDSTLSVDKAEIELAPGQKREFQITPIWEKFVKGSHYSSIVLEAARKETLRATIPIKINKY